jgi:hypothetical protein
MVKPERSTGVGMRRAYLRFQPTRIRLPSHPSMAIGTCNGCRVKYPRLQGTLCGICMGLQTLESENLAQDKHTDLESRILVSTCFVSQFLRLGMTSECSSLPCYPSTEVAASAVARLPTSEGLISYVIPALWYFLVRSHSSHVY